MLFDPLYWLIMGPAMLLAVWAQARVRSAYETYSQVYASSGLTGSELARRLLQQAGLHDVAVEGVAGQLTDHYDPRNRVVRLSEGVYNSRSLAALGVAAHEVGHALQHRDGYIWLNLRNSIVPITQIGSNLAMPLVILGLILGALQLVDLGIILFSLAVLFQLVTLPVEFNASSRALATLADGGYVSSSEIRPIRSVLSAAALTYFAALVTALLQLVYLFTLRGRR
ncbi:MAG TPA: zinc metallopeptidase [Sphingobacteriaceae bacterium]|nr:zinc metallopeptidase [Sphingobacteriaceae bacterium]